jgi:hypothetical protein
MVKERRFSLRRREFSFLIIWIINPIAILMYQNCSPASLQKTEPEIRPIVQDKIDRTSDISSGR